MALGILSVAASSLSAQVPRDAPPKPPLPDTSRERNIGTFILGLLENSPPLSVRGSVDVSADDDLKDTLSSYLLRELRQLPNIVVVDEKSANYAIHIVGFATVAKSQTATGYAMAIAITKPEHLENDRSLVESVCAAPGERTISDDKWQLLKGKFDNQDSLQALWLRTAGTSALRDLAARIIADFDVQFIEPLRKGDQDMRDQIKDFRKRQPAPTPQ